MARIVCRNCEQCWICMVCWEFLSYAVKFYCCWTWQIWSVFYVESCGVSSTEYHVHLVGVNRLSACRKFFGVHIVGKMAQDVGMLWMCCGVPVLFDWFLRVPSLHAFVFIRKLFGDLLLLFLFFFFFFWNCMFLKMVREKRGGKRRQGEGARSVKYESIELCCSKCFQVKL